MKRWFVTVGVLGLIAAAHAQTASPTQPGAASDGANSPATSSISLVAKPVSPTQPDNARYTANPAILTACQARLQAFATKPCDIVFVGDSLTEGWNKAGKAIWDQAYASRNALNFGVDGDTTQNVIWRLNNMDVQTIHPRVAVVLVGKNNADNSVHEIADGIQAVLTNTEIAFPGVKIILVSLVPSGDDDNDKLMQVNSIIRSYADNTTVSYLNLVPLMTASTKMGADGIYTTNYKGLDSDGVHLDAIGYQIWHDAMEPVLAKLLSGG